MDNQPESNGLLPEPRSSDRRSRYATRATYTVAGVVLGFFAVALIAAQAIFLLGGLVSSVEVQARIIAANSSAALAFGDINEANHVLDALASSPSLTAAGLYDLRGRRVGAYEGAGRRGLRTIPPVGIAPGITSSSYRVDMSGIEVIQPVEYRGAVLGTVVILATLGSVFNGIATYAVTTLLVALAALSLAIPLLRKTAARAAEAESRLDYLAHTDPVTGLPNRHAFNERFALALGGRLARHRPIGLALLDIDDFKRINDTFGHGVGDELLAQVAGRLLHVAEADDVVCRLGGDEFAIILRLNGQRDARTASRRLLSAFDAPFSAGGQELYATPSIGVSVWPEDGASAAELMRHADTAMYHAKSEGKNTVAVFDRLMNRGALARHALERNLRSALERDELSVHYQPLVIPSSGLITGFEALARWHDGARGAVPPLEFIPIAEDTGLIVQLGKVVLRKAVRQAQTWRELGYLDLKIAVNVSARQLRDLSFTDDVLALLATCGVPASMLTIEVTESLLMEPSSPAVQQLATLRHAGVHVAIDDFGTGYSSLSYLKNLPVDYLKIDRSFMQGIPGNGEPLASAIVAMGHTLCLRVVAEGIETAGQAAFLMRTGCDLAQGFWFSRPLDAEQATGLLTSAGAIAEGPENVHRHAPVSTR